MAKWKQITLILLGFVLVWTGKISGVAAQSGFVQITPDNSGQVQILETLPDYHDATDYCSCDVRFFSQNGRVVATDWKIHDLTSGTTLNFAEHGYPLALSPDGSWAIVSGQNSGTRLVEIPSGTETVLTADDVEAALFSPDGKLVVTSSKDADAIQVWDAEARKSVNNLGRPSFGVSGLQFSSDGELIWLDRDANLFVGDPLDDSHARQTATNVYDFTLTPDGATILVRRFDFETVEAWDLAAGQLLGRVVDTHDQSGVDSIALSPDKHTLAINYFGGNARLELWNIATSEEPAQIAELEGGGERQMIFTPDSQLLLVTGGRGTAWCSRDGDGCGYSSFGGFSKDIQLVNTMTGAIAGVIKGDKDFITETALSADGHLLITASGYGYTTIQVWSLDGTTGTLLATLLGDNFVFSPDESTLLVEINKDFLALYGIATEERTTKPFLLPGRIKPSSVNVRADPDSSAPVVGSASGDVRALGRSSDNQYVFLPEYQGWVRAEPTYFVMALNMPLETLGVIDQTPVATATVMPTAAPELESTATPQVVISASTDLSTLRIPVGKPLVVPPDATFSLSRITVDNAAEVTLLGVLRDSYSRANTFPSIAAAVSADGLHLVTAPNGQTTHPQLWNLLAFTSQDGPDMATDYVDWIMAGSLDGKYIAYGQHDYFEPLSLWSTAAQSSRVFVDSDHAPSIIGVGLVFSPDGKTLAFQGGLLDIPSLEIRAKVEDTGALSFSPDSRLLAISNYERVYIYDVKTGTLLARTPRIGKPYDSNTELRAVQFSPNGAYLAVISSTQVFIFQSESGELVYSLPYQHDPAYRLTADVHFSPDGQTLAVLDLSGILQLWETCTGVPLGAYDTGGAKGIAFSPDGHLLALSNPLRIVDVLSGQIAVAGGDFGGSYLNFSLDGSTLLVDGSTQFYDQPQSIMAFGIPNTLRPAWQPLYATIVPSAINVRATPDADSKVIGSASGKVVVSGRDVDGEALYLLDIGGWVWSDDNYLDLGDHTITDLPVLAVEK